MNEGTLSHLVVAHGLLSGEQLRQLLAQKARGDRRPLAAMLLDHGLVSPDQLARLQDSGPVVRPVGWQTEELTRSRRLASSGGRPPTRPDGSGDRPAAPSDRYPSAGSDRYPGSDRFPGPGPGSRPGAGSDRYPRGPHPGSDRYPGAPGQSGPSGTAWRADRSTVVESQRDGRAARAVRATDAGSASGRRPSPGASGSFGASSKLLRSSLLKSGQRLELTPGVGVSIQRVIGQGGMGMVFLVEDPVLGRPAALKLIKEGGSRTRALRFRREAEVTARLDHPGIPPVYLGGQTPDGQDFLLMRYVAGESLEDAIRGLHDLDGAQQGAPRGVRALLEAVVKMGEALAYAHSRGVVHRDLKPANVMIGAFGEVLVMDWGLARDLNESDQEDEVVRGPDDSDRMGLTQDGAVLGTPGYMPPEQARSEELTPLADVWALGSILTAVLTGRPAVDADSTLEAIALTAKGEVTLPRERDPGVPPELNAIAAKALAPVPDDRYRRAEAFAQDLKAYLEGRPVTVFRYGALAQAGRLLRRHPAVFVGLAVAFLLSLFSMWAVQRAASDAARTERETAVARARLAAADAWADVEDRGAAGADADDRIGLLLGALQASERWRVMAPDDREAAAAQFRAAMGLGEVALETEQWALARQAFGQAEGLGVDDAAARAAVERVEEERTGEARRRREVVEELFVRAERGDLTLRSGALHEAVYEVLRFADPAVLALVVERLDDVTRELAAIERDVYAEVAEPDRHEAAAGQARIEGVADALAFRQEAALREDLPPRHREVLELADERLKRRAYRLFTGHVSSALQVVARRQADEVPAGRLSVARLACEVLGRLGVDDAAAARAIGRYLAVEGDGIRAIHGGLALCNIGTELALRILLDARARFHDTRFREAVDRAVGRVETDLPLAEPTARGHLRRGVARQAKGDLAGALADLDAALALDASLVEALDARGHVRLALGDPEAALADYDRACELEPDDAGHWGNRSNALHALGDLEGALQAMARAVALEPRDARLYTNRSLIQEDAGDVEAALADLDRCLELDPQMDVAWNNRGKMRMSQGDVEGALADFDRAIAISPDEGRFYANRAGVRASLGDMEGGLADAERALEMLPDEPVCWYARGSIRMQQGRLEKALEDFRRAVELAPDMAALWDNLSVAYQRAGDAAGAIRAAEQGVEADPEDPFTYQRRALAYAAAGDVGRARADFERALGLDPDAWQVYRSRARFRARLGEGEGALDDVDRALEVAPGEAGLYALRAELRRARGDLEAALADLDRALELEPEEEQLLRLRGALRARVGGVADAEADFDQAVAIDPGDFEARINRGKARLQLGRVTEALEDFNEAVALRPDAAEAFASRGHARLVTDDLRGALADFERATELDPGHGQAWVGLGLVREALGDLHLARRALERGLAIAPDEPAGLLAAARVEDRVGDPEQALRHVERFLDLEPDEPGGYLVRSEVLARLGDRASAVADLEEVLRLEPDTPDRAEIERQLARLRGE